tara:strand:- start:2455 stop:4089 length:1635 start_codon:yes stop_codon:yes gene_type:complete
MVGANPVLVLKQQTRLSDFYPVSLPEVPTSRAQDPYFQFKQNESIPATTQSKLSDFDTYENMQTFSDSPPITFQKPFDLPEVSPLSAEQQLNMHLDELRAKTENPEDIVEQYIQDMRSKRNVSNVPKRLAELTEEEIMRNINPVSYTKIQNKFGRLKGPRPDSTPEQPRSETLLEGLRNTPQFRDYFGRQTTLPEHFPSYHTEDWLDPKTGLVREGAVAPVTAVRRASNRDIMGGMAQTGGGLIPLPNYNNESYESRNTGRRPMLVQSQNPPLEHFQSGYFLTTPYVADLDRAVTTHDTNALIGVRGFGAPSGDIFQARPAGEAKEGATEAIVHSRIAPERLVPFRYNDSYKNMIRGDGRSKTNFLSLNDIRNFFRPKTAQDFRQAIGREKDDTISRNQKFAYIRDHLPFMQYAPPEFEDMVDRHGMPAVLTNDEKIRLLEAIEEEDRNYFNSGESRERQLGRKLGLIRRLGASDWWDRPNTGDALTLRDLTLPQTWGDPMAALANAPPHTKDALIELFNHRFNTSYPTNKKLTQFEELSELFG